ncbi:MAG TPA: aminotransferase class III-fold pyridoxal phosphate-dependent enzyme, partial [Desulfobaccales bacterium]|nr:aminotransferase class III-fold pyridoxal phosphate-dependent enzyme [Desulfobaccales bacterium]
ERGAFLQDKLTDLQNRFAVIKEVRGLGLMWGLELDKDGAPVVNACRERGLLVNCTQGNIIRLLPPLVVSNKELETGLGILAEALALL